MLIKSILMMLVVCGLALPAAAQPFYVRGDMNGWTTDNIMTDMGGGRWQATLTGLTPGQAYEYKVTTEDWGQSWPGSNGKLMADAAGETTVHLYMTPAADGWNPVSTRVGYEDSGLHGWDIMGAFNGWSGPFVTLTDLGSGLYAGTATVPTAGSYEFKFRKDGDWLISIGNDFGNAAANNQITTVTDGEQVLFELDLPNGRWRAVNPGAVPTTILSWGAVKALYRR